LLNQKWDTAQVGLPATYLGRQIASRQELSHQLDAEKDGFEDIIGCRRCACGKLELTKSRVAAVVDFRKDAFNI
jgi:hypothetical protein